MKKAIIFGIGIFTETFQFYLDQDKSIQICGYTVDSKYRNCDEYNGLPLVDFETVEETFPPAEYGIYICVGYTKMNTIRENIFHAAQKKGYEILSYYHPSAIINSKAMGLGNIVLENVWLDIFTEIGNGNIFYSNTVIGHHTTIGDFNCFSSSTVGGCCRIGSNSFLGLKSIIKDKIVVADKTLIGAACYIHKNTKPGDVYANSSTKKLDRIDSMLASEIL